LVIAVLAKTAKFEVLRRSTVGPYAISVPGNTIIATSNGVSSNGINRIFLSVFINLFILFAPLNSDYFRYGKPQKTSLILFVNFICGFLNFFLTFFQDLLSCNF